MAISNEGTRTIETEEAINKNISVKNFLKLEKTDYKYQKNICSNLKNQ